MEKKIDINSLSFRIESSMVAILGIMNGTLKNSGSDLRFEMMYQNQPLDKVLSEMKEVEVLPLEVEDEEISDEEFNNYKYIYGTKEEMIESRRSFKIKEAMLSKHENLVLEALKGLPYNEIDTIFNKVKLKIRDKFVI